MKNRGLRSGVKRQGSLRVKWTYAQVAVHSGLGSRKQCGMAGMQVSHWCLVLEGRAWNWAGACEELKAVLRSWLLLQSVNFPVIFIWRDNLHVGGQLSW